MLNILAMHLVNILYLMLIILLKIIIYLSFIGFGGVFSKKRDEKYNPFI